MNYPFWDVGIGYGILMAIIAILHVYISHFAIGGGLYLVVAELFARKKNNQVMLLFLEKLSKFFVIVTLVIGAVTGVGIWFIIGLLNPAATEALIHHFVWGWATEWTFFIIEITAAILYFYGWKRLSAKNHLALGWIYFIAAWLSLFVINGILQFMLTPGTWLETGSFWDGFFNPSFWSTLFLRTGISVMLGGVFALLVASRYKPDEDKKKLVRYNAFWAIIGIVIMIPTIFWFTATIPDAAKELFMNTHLTPVSAMNASFINLILLAVTVLLFGLLIPKRYNLIVAVIAMAFAFSWFGEFEWMRESIRKPYVIYDYMYGNGIELAQADTYRQDGYLEHIKFKTGNDGKDLYNRACRSCHTMNGYKPLKPAYDGTDKQFIAQSIMGSHAMRGIMPEFMGTEEEAALIADYIYEHTDKRHLSEIYNLTGVELGRKVYDIRCGKCHVFGGFSDKTESLSDLTAEDYNDMLDMAGDFAEEMPDFTGDQNEREALIQFLQSLGKGGTK